MKLRLAPGAESFRKRYASASPHALLLTGRIGVGLGTFARQLAEENGQLLTIITPESKTTALSSISVERIRELYDQARTKQVTTSFIIIDDADRMNHYAQNALLKLLEEPNESIRFILTSHSPDTLLPTIRSRTQSFTVPMIDTIESKRLLQGHSTLDDLTVQRLLFVAEGLPAELTRLISNQSDFKKLADRVQLARQIVEGSPYQRLALLQSFGGDRKDMIALIEMVISLLRRSLETRPEPSSIRMIDRLVGALAAIRANGSAKLHASAAML